MANSKVVSIRLPQTLLDALDRLAEVKYPSRQPGHKPNRTQIILDAIETYLSSSSGDVNSRHTPSASLPDKLPSEWEELVRQIVKAEVATARQVKSCLGELSA